MTRPLPYLAAAVLLATPLLGRAAEVRIENRTDDAIFVAVAYQKWKGDLAAEGWTKIDSGGSHTFRADDASHMHLRVERRGREVTWAALNSYLNWPLSNERFTVSKPDDDPSIRILRWGSQLERRHFMRKDDKLPDGWQTKRFFHVGNQNLHLHVNP